MRPRHVVPLIVAGALVVVLLLTFGSPFSKTSWVDLRTGQERDALELLGVTLHERILATEFSRMYKERFTSKLPPKWEPVSRYSWPRGHHSPSYGFIDVFRWQDMITIAFERCSFSSSVKDCVLRNFINLLEREDPSAAVFYAGGVAEYSGEHAGAKLDSSNAPSWMLIGSSPPK